MTQTPASPPELKTLLHGYLKAARSTLLWKLDGLSEFDVRRPLTPTGTNLLGVVKHVASVELGYLGEVFGRPSSIQLPWFAQDAPDNADMWAPADQSRADIIGLYHASWTHGDAVIEELPLDARGEVPWWAAGTRTVSLEQILVHLIAETNRHCGHADIVRELIDGAVGYREGNTNLPTTSEDYWPSYAAQLQAVAEQFR